MVADPAPRPSRQGPGDPSIRRTWWLLAGAFLLLAITNGIRLLGSGQAIDWLTVALVIVAAIAAIGHRNAVAGLEARGRGEAESFARILRGLSRSVSGDAIVTAILDDLVDAVGADHVVLVRRRRDGRALEATLVTRRDGVPSTMTILPLSDLEAPVDAPARAPVAVPVGGGAGFVPETVAATALVGVSAAELSATLTAGAITAAATPAPAVAALIGAQAIDAGIVLPGSGGTGVSASLPLSASMGATAALSAPATSPGSPTQAGSMTDVRRGARRATDAARGRAMLRRSLAEGLALLHDLGLPSLGLPGPRASAGLAEVLARGDEAVVTDRIASRVRAAFGLSHTLAAPLRSEDRLFGAIVLSRRDRAAWPESARRLVRGAASETAAALARADSHRAATASASTDPLTGLPNRRYFDEFSRLLARRRRAGDAVAVLMIDIDKFKGLNDTYGHPVGDEVLRSVAGAITSAVRDQDVPARIGGEEFAVLLRNPGPEVALEVGERVRQAVRNLDLAEVGVPGVRVSVGVANARTADEPIEALIDRADRALLKAKRTGRDKVVPG